MLLYILKYEPKKEKSDLASRLRGDVISIAGRVDVGDIKELKKRLSAYVAENDKHFWVYADVDEANSQFVNSIAHLRNICGDKGLHFGIFYKEGKEFISESLRVSGLNNWLYISPLK